MAQEVKEVMAEQRPMTPTEQIVANTWAAELGLTQVGLDEDFIDLGSHSLQGMAIIARLEATFGIPIPVRTLFEEPTVADLAAWIDVRRSDAVPPAVELVRLQTGSGLRPIFALPGGGGGAWQLYTLAKLARQTDPARPFLALPGDPPVPASTRPEDRVPAAAAMLNEGVRAHQPSGPYLLLGSCVGGVFAWEMAHQLETAGSTVHLFLVDTRVPQLRPGEPSFRQVFNQSLTATERRAWHRKRRTWRRQHAALFPSAGDSPEGKGKAAKRRLVMARTYAPRPFAGRVTLLVNQWWHRVDPTLGWDTVRGDDLDVTVIGQRHALEWNTPEISSRLRSWLDEIDPG